VRGAGRKTRGRILVKARDASLAKSLLTGGLAELNKKIAWATSSLCRKSVLMYRVSGGEARW
jgi:hypothetical protein